MSKTRCRSLVAALLVSVVAWPAYAEDLVEFLSGAKARGTVREIRKEEKQLDVEIVGGNMRTSKHLKRHGAVAESIGLRKQQHCLILAGREEVHCLVAAQVQRAQFPPAV
jgi:selenophosphate synthetase-related protein